MPHRSTSRLAALAASGVLLAAAPALAGPSGATADDAAHPAGDGRSDAVDPTRWRLVAEEGFDDPLAVDSAKWVKDPYGPESPWHVDEFDDDGEVWKAISDPYFSSALSSFGVFRKRVAFGTDDWLTAEIAAQDKDNDGAPDSRPGLRTVSLPGGGSAGQIHEPSWDGGVLIRPTRPLPSEYRVEMTLRGIAFGGERNGSLTYSGTVNGYREGDCKTGYPWTFRGAVANRERCGYGKVNAENGFYYMTILDYDTPAPHGNPGIHFHRKIIMDGYNSTASWSQKYGICNPETGQIKSVQDGNLNAINAIFVRGDKFRPQNNNVSNEYFYRTSCGDYSGDGTFGPNGEYKDILSTAEIQPELMPNASYTFAVERDRTGYTIEMTGPFRHIGQATLLYHHDFVEDGRPIWHYNQTPGEYDGRFDRSLTHTGPTGSYTTEHTWPAGSAYPDSFIIGDPHLNYYEGSAVVDDIRLYVPQTD
jgi:hypothetical protein